MRRQPALARRAGAAPARAVLARRPAAPLPASRGPPATAARASRTPGSSGSVVLAQWVDDPRRRRPRAAPARGARRPGRCAVRRTCRAMPPYERDFVVVQWDQRGAGRTYQRHGAATPGLTLDRLAEDGVELARLPSLALPRPRPRRAGPLVGLGDRDRDGAPSPGPVRGVRRDRSDRELGRVGPGSVRVPARAGPGDRRCRDAGRARRDRAPQSDGRPAVLLLHPATCAASCAPPTPPGSPAPLSRSIRRAPGMTEETLRALMEGADFSGRVLLPTQMRTRLSSDALRFAVPVPRRPGPRRPVHADRPGRGLLPRGSRPRGNSSW